MARKTKEEAERTREAILDVALEVFSERGLSRTSLNDIASRAGFTRGAVYWHFKDKADLFVNLARNIESRQTPKSCPVWRATRPRYPNWGR